MNDFLNIVYKRKSIRSFSNEIPSKELIEKIIRIAAHAPTNCNQQLWNFIVIENQKIKERLVAEAASNTLFLRVPTIIFITYDGWNYKEAVQGASLALGHLILAATYYGLSASPINSYGADSKIKQILHIPEMEVICCAVTLGYPDERAEKQPLVPRRPIEEVIHWDGFQKKDMPPCTYGPNDWILNHLRAHQRYYCRKTFLGKEMDIMSAGERRLVRDSLAATKSPCADLFSYDGCYLREFPAEHKIMTFDLTEETSQYTRAAATLTCKNQNRFSYARYSEDAKLLCDQPMNTITMLYKLERIPAYCLPHLFKQAYHSLAQQGEYIIIARKRNPFLSFFLFVIKLLFGNDIRKTGMYAFFGPYRPITLNRTLKQLHHAGFQDIQWNGYFFIPPLYEQIYQMFVQYIRSEGSSYLHRHRCDDRISRLLERLMRLQGFHRIGRLGSVAVIRCKK